MDRSGACSAGRSAVNEWAQPGRGMDPWRQDAPVAGGPQGAPMSGWTAPAGPGPGGPVPGGPQPGGPPRDPGYPPQGGVAPYPPPAGPGYPPQGGVAPYPPPGGPAPYPGMPPG